MIKVIFVLIGVFFIAGCGVRGDPIPPKAPPNLGRGQPMYRGATQDLKFPSVPPVYAPATKTEEKENKDEKK